MQNPNNNNIDHNPEDQRGVERDNTTGGNYAKIFAVILIAIFMLVLLRSNIFAFLLLIVPAFYVCVTLLAFLKDPPPDATTPQGYGRKASADAQGNSGAGPARSSRMQSELDGGDARGYGGASPARSAGMQSEHDGVDAQGYGGASSAHSSGRLRKRDGTEAVLDYRLKEEYNKRIGRLGGAQGHGASGNASGAQGYGASGNASGAQAYDDSDYDDYDYDDDFDFTPEPPPSIFGNNNGRLFIDGVTGGSSGASKQPKQSGLFQSSKQPKQSGLFQSSKPAKQPKPDKKSKPISKSKARKAAKKAEALRKEKEFDEMAFWINVFDDED